MESSSWRILCLYEEKWFGSNEMKVYVLRLNRETEISRKRYI